MINDVGIQLDDQHLVLINLGPMCTRFGKFEEHAGEDNELRIQFSLPVITVSDPINMPLKIITNLGWRIIRARKLTFWSMWCTF